MGGVVTTSLMLYCVSICIGMYHTISFLYLLFLDCGLININYSAKYFMCLARVQDFQIQLHKVNVSKMKDTEKDFTEKRQIGFSSAGHFASDSFVRLR